MSRLKVDIQCDNDAFVDLSAYDGFDRAEVSRILRRLADRIDAGVTGGDVRDLNGNKVGNWDLEIDGGHET